MSAQIIDFAAAKRRIAFRMQREKREGETCGACGQPFRKHEFSGVSRDGQRLHVVCALKQGGVL